MEHLYFVKHFACIPPKYGGLNVYVKRLSLALTRNGYPSGAFYHDEIAGIPSSYHHLYDRMVHHAHSLFVLPEIVRLYKIFKDYSLIHCHLSFTTYFCVWLIHKLQNKPVVLTVHNEMIEREIKTLNCVDRYCLKSLLKDHRVQFVAVSTNAKCKIENVGYHISNPIKVVPAYIKPVEIGQADDYLSGELIDFLRKHKQYMLFYAESFSYNNSQEIYGTELCIDTFVAMKERHPELALVFCMPNMNDENRLKELKDKVIKSGCSDSVYWQLTAITEMWPLLKSATLYFRPTSTDGDSVLLREALGLGVVSLASDSVLRPKECHTFSLSDDIQAIVDKCEDLCYVNTIKPQCEQKDYYSDIMDVYNSLLDK